MLAVSFLIIVVIGMFFINTRLTDAKAAAEAKATAENQTAEREKAARTLQKTVTQLAEQAKAQGVQVSFAFYDTAHQTSIDYDATRQQHPASVYKLYLATAVLEAVENGDLPKHTVLPSTGLSLYDAIGLMIVYSDNDTAVDLGEAIGWDQVEKACQRWGLAQTSFHPQFNGSFTGDIISSAHDTMLFLRKFNAGELLNEKNQAFLYQKMQHQSFNNALSLGLTQGTFAHKTGFLDNQWNDCGIIETENNRYLVAVYAQNYADWMPQAQTFYQSLGEAINTYIKTVSATM